MIVSGCIYLLFRNLNVLRGLSWLRTHTREFHARLCQTTASRVNPSNKVLTCFLRCTESIISYTGPTCALAISLMMQRDHVLLEISRQLHRNLDMLLLDGDLALAIFGSLCLREVNGNLKCCKLLVKQLNLCLKCGLLTVPDLSSVPLQFFNIF